MSPRCLVAALLLCVACGDDARVVSDGGPALDAGPRDLGLDAGAAPDAAVARDAGEPADAGESADAGAGDFGIHEDAGELACEDGVVSLGSPVSATTAGGADERNPDGAECLAAFASGPERVYAFTAPDAGDYRVTVTPDSATFDPMLYVQPNCDDSSACLAIAGLNGPGTADATTVALAEGQRVLITVDTDLRMGGDTRGGPFTLVVERAP